MTDLGARQESATYLDLKPRAHTVPTDTTVETPTQPDNQERTRARHREQAP